MRVSKYLLAVSLLAFMLVLLPRLGFAQTQTTPDFNSGFTPYQQYHGGDIDSINMATGSVNLHIPLISFPQKGSGLRLTFAINYNSAVVKRPRIGFGAQAYWQWSQVDTNPMSVSILDDQIYGLYENVNCQPNPPCGKSGQVAYHYYSVVSADGAQHLMGYTSGKPSQNSGPLALRSLDMTGLYATIPNAANGYAGYTIYDEHGTQYSGWPSDGTGITSSGWRKDTNGNMVSETSGVYTDTISRSIPAPPTPQSTNNTDSTGCTGPLPIAKAVLWQVPGYNGTTYPIKFCYVNITFNIYDDGAGGQNGGPDGLAGGAVVLQSIVLPNAQTLSFTNGTTWKFEYNDQDSGGQYGTLTKVTLPTGGSISYVYQLLGDSRDLQRSVSQRTVSDGTTSRTWNYSYTLPQPSQVVGTTTVTAPKLDYDSQPNDTVYTVTEANFDSGFVTQVAYYQGSHSSGTLLKTDTKAITTFANPYFTGSSTVPGFGPNRAGQMLTQETITFPSGPVSQTQYSYDSGFIVYDSYGNPWSSNFYYGLQTQSKFFDYGSGGPGPILKQVQNTFIWQANSNYFAANLLDRTSSVTTLDSGGNQFAQTTYGYDENNGSPQGVFGNRTSVTQWLNGGTAPKSQTVFNALGMPVKTIDPNLNSTTITYDSTGIFPSQVQHPDTTSNGTVVHHIDGYTYDANTGLMSSHTDQNLLKTSFGYDAMRRLTSVAYPDGGSEGYSFNDTPPTPSFTFTKAINSGSTLAKFGKLDGLGRTTQTQLTSDPQGTAYTDTTYDAVGRVETVSNPYRSGVDITSSPGTTSFGYDALGRKTKQTYPDGSVLTTAYCGASTLVTDPTKRWRRSRTDGLGRLVEVDEPNAIGASVASTGCPGTGEPIWVTSYTLDALGNLTNVAQNGSHQRTFTYDSLSRLLCANNPENSSAACPAFGVNTFPAATVTYTYDANGNVTAKKDARTINTAYSYDALNRELTRTYSNGDATVTTTYDQSTCLSLSACQNVGQRTSVTDAAGSEAFAYQVDKTNSRTVHVDQRTTNSLTKSSTYYLDLAGNITEIVYPTGRILNYTYDAADRPSTAVDASNGITYATGPGTSPGGTCIANVTCYTPQGSLYAVSIGQTSTFTGLNVTNSYNARLQPNEFKASSTGGNAIDITYSYVDPVNGGNAGHVFSVTNSLNSSRTQSFSYDQVNRILSAGTSATTGSYCWGYQYSYDAWGNLTSQAGWTPNYNGCTQTVLAGVTADGNNHISAFGYDAAGNATSDGTYIYAWDAESQLKSAAGVNYSYDGDGRRVSKVGSKLYWYGAGGEILAETDASGNTTAEYVFFGGKRIAMLPAGSTAQYYVEDSLGSSRIVTTNTGVVCYDADFYPFGGERPVVNSCAQNNYKFEGKERDTETGNDDFGARYYSWRFGRWLSADWSNVPAPVPYANLTNPQTLNLYSMVGDDPESFADLDGHGCSSSGAAAAHPAPSDNCTPTNDNGPQTKKTNDVAQNPNPDQPQQPEPAKPQGDQAPDSNSRSSAGSDPGTTSTTSGQTQAPMESRGQGGQARGGERGKTSKPDNPRKHTRPSKEHPGQYEVQDHQTGKWVLKPRGWSPDTAVKMGTAAAVIGAAVYVVHVIITTAPEWLPYVAAGAAAF